MLSLEQMAGDFDYLAKPSIDAILSSSPASLDEPLRPTTYVCPPPKTITPSPTHPSNQQGGGTRSTSSDSDSNSSQQCTSLPHPQAGVSKTRRERLNSALYLRLKKRKTFFSFGNCRIVPKNVKGWTLLYLLTYILLQNIKKLEGGTLWGYKKIFGKSRTVPKKIQRGPFRHVRFCRFP